MGLNMEFEYIDEEVHPLESLEGRLLVSSLTLDGTFFQKALIYICAHDDKGAIGVIINHPSKESINLKDYIPKDAISKGVKNKKIPLLTGGPVESERLLILSLSKEQEKDFDKLPRVTIYTETENFLHDYAFGFIKDKFIVIKGFAAWDPGQLEKEITSNSWLVTSPTADVLFSQKMKNKWEKVVESMGVKNLTNLVNYTGNA
jgi:putative transcriptional regulator